ncbi:hypothetical protein ACIPF8_22815 [Collimonas sp. NPDC087041]|uniref:hypothetical protein n=1 Tax=Collimonas sp. NPDC087041 TaxID=3363960 RepID=UPI003811FDC6
MQKKSEGYTSGKNEILDENVEIILFAGTLSCIGEGPHPTFPWLTRYLIKNVEVRFLPSPWHIAQQQLARPLFEWLLLSVSPFALDQIHCPSLY